VACPIDSYTAWAAAKHGDLPMLKFLYSIGHSVARYSMLQSAAESGSVELMAWLVEHGAVLEASVLSTAAVRNHLQLCQYLFERGCRLTANVTDFLLKSKQVSVLEWALSQSIEFTAEQQQQYEQLKVAEQLEAKAKADAEAQRSVCGKRKRRACM
jgi:Ankyrin repeats (3 copies)